jgi:hypothetical protein
LAVPLKTLIRSHFIERSGLGAVIILKSMIRRERRQAMRSLPDDLAGYSLTDAESVAVSGTAVSICSLEQEPRNLYFKLEREGSQTGTACSAC